jgi:hypothetical protein
MCNHRRLPPAEHLAGAQIDRYIVDKLYWMLHAPRQTGKTTFLRQLCDGFAGRGVGKFPISIALIGE